MAEFYSATVRLFDRFCGPVLLRDSQYGWPDVIGITGRIAPEYATWLSGTELTLVRLRQIERS